MIDTLRFSRLKEFLIPISYLHRDNSFEDTLFSTDYPDIINLYKLTKECSNIYNIYNLNSAYETKNKKIKEKHKGKCKKQSLRLCLKKDKREDKVEV